MEIIQKLVKLVLIISLFGSISSCKNVPPSKTHVSLLVDLTGSYHDNIPDINSDAIIRLFHLDNTNNYGVFRTDFISDVNYSKVQQVSLRPVASMVEYNEFERESEVSNFKKRTSELIDKVNSTPRGRPHSAVYVPFARRLNFLAKSNADRKVLLVYSDLFENSTFFRFYERQNMELLANNPKEVQALFEKQLPIAEDLTGIDVYIVYQAPNETASAAFQLFSNSIYKPLLEERGANLIIGANLVL